MWGRLSRTIAENWESFHSKLKMEWKMRHWRDLTELYKVTSNVRELDSEYSKMGYEKDEKNQRRSKLRLAFELYYKKESSVRTLIRKIQQLCLVFELCNTKEIGVRTQRRKMGSHRSNPLCSVRRYRKLKNGILPYRSNSLCRVRTL